MEKIIWNGWARTAAFWSVVSGTLFLSDRFTALDLDLIVQRITAILMPSVEGRRVSASAWAGLSQSDFAFNLAGLLLAFGVGLLLAFLIMHGLAIGFSLGRAGRILKGYKDRQAFAQDYEAKIYPALIKHPLVGHAWREFDETLLKHDFERGGVIGNTVRPHSFVNYGLVRERLMGVKLIASIPGYFVGVGLLLTFAGIVLALAKASDATTASLVNSDTPAMMTAMTDLLGVASFKFATSIAGLGVSIFLALMFKIMVIGIEGRFHRFCELIETNLKYTAPQSIAAELNETAKEQCIQLKEINSERFFSRMGEQLSPQISSAFASAIEPMTQSIGDAMKTMANRSENGVGELLDRFSTSVQGSAGTELKQLGG